MSKLARLEETIERRKERLKEVQAKNEEIFQKLKDDGGRAREGSSALVLLAVSIAIAIGGFFGYAGIGYGKQYVPVSATRRHGPPHLEVAGCRSNALSKYFSLAVELRHTCPSIGCEDVIAISNTGTLDRWVGHEQIHKTLTKSEMNDLFYAMTEACLHDTLREQHAVVSPTTTLQVRFQDRAVLVRHEDGKESDAVLAFERRVRDLAGGDRTPSELPLVASEKAWIPNKFERHLVDFDLFAIGDKRYRVMVSDDIGRSLLVHDLESAVALEDVLQPLAIVDVDRDGYRDIVVGQNTWTAHFAPDKNAYLPDR